jgi:hypothetical protein
MKFNQTVLGLAVALVATSSWGPWRAWIQYGLEDHRRPQCCDYGLRTANVRVRLTLPT